MMAKKSVIFLMRASVAIDFLLRGRALEFDHEAVFLEAAGNGAGENLGQVEFMARKDLKHGDEAAGRMGQLEDEAGVRRLWRIRREEDRRR